HARTPGGERRPQTGRRGVALRPASSSGCDARPGGDHAATEEGGGRPVVRREAWYPVRLLLSSPRQGYTLTPLRAQLVYHFLASRHGATRSRSGRAAPPPWWAYVRAPAAVWSCPHPTWPSADT